MHVIKNIKQDSERNFTMTARRKLLMKTFEYGLCFLSLSSILGKVSSASTSFVKSIKNDLFVIEQV